MNNLETFFTKRFCGYLNYYFETLLYIYKYAYLYIQYIYIYIYIYVNNR